MIEPVRTSSPATVDDVVVEVEVGAARSTAAFTAAVESARLSSVGVDRGRSR